MREIRQSGSVRGVRRKPYPYRDCASGVICRSTHPEGARVVCSQGRRRAFCGGSEEKFRLLFGRDFCLETQTQRAVQPKQNAKCHGARTAYSRGGRKNTQDKRRSILCAGFQAKPSGSSTCFSVEIRASMLQRSIFLDAVQCCHPGPSRYDDVFGD